MVTKFSRFYNLTNAITLLRICVAGIFLAHATMRLATGTIERFGSFLESKGFAYGTATVWCITVFEVGAGLLMAAGYLTKWMASGFILLLIMGIVIIHIKEGWFNGEFGTGGCEYSVSLIAALIVIASSAHEKDMCSD